jgi:hypothetical protein
LVAIPHLRRLTGAVTLAVLVSSSVLLWSAPPAIATSDATISLVVSPDGTAQVGDTITITPTITGIESWAWSRCFFYFEFGESDFRTYKSLRVAGDDCAPWTFVVPPTSPGAYRIFAEVLGDDADGAAQMAGSAEIFGSVVEGGTPTAFASNYPVRSWDVDEFLTTPIPQYGSPFTMRGTGTAVSCQLEIGDGTALIWVRQLAGCQDWTATLPELIPGALAPISGWVPDLRIDAWEDTGSFVGHRPEDVDRGWMGARWGQTWRYQPLSWFTAADPSASPDFTSDLPAIFAPDARAAVR